jgi:hypothetical protein
LADVTRIAFTEGTLDLICCNAVGQYGQPCIRRVDCGDMNFEEQEQALRNTGWGMTPDGELHICDRHTGMPEGARLTADTTVLVKLRDSADHGFVERATDVEFVGLPNSSDSLGGALSRTARLRYASDGQMAEFPLAEIAVVASPGSTT